MDGVWETISIQEAEEAILYWVREIKPELVRGIPKEVHICLSEDEICIDIRTYLSRS